VSLVTELLFGATVAGVLTTVVAVAIGALWWLVPLVIGPES
jgi:hypothetical protein